MAAKRIRPGRTLTVFGIVLVLSYVLVALTNSWKPELGLDLQGGQQISLTAEAPKGGSVSQDALNDARDIIDARVNGSGVTAAKVTTDGGNVIQVSIPGNGETQKDLAQRVSKTAKLRFRLVACDQGTAVRCTSSAAPALTQPTTGSGITGAQRPPFAATPSPSASPSSSPSASPSAAAQPESGDVDLKDALAFMAAPPTAWQQRFASFQCPQAGVTVDDQPGQPLVTCDDQGQKYLLTPAIIEGTEISNADYSAQQNGVGFAVNLDFHSRGSGIFADATGAIAGDDSKLFAITLDGVVVSAATASERISGSAQITGNFDATTAKALATNLKYGSLPLDFPAAGQSSRTVGPSLAGSQLSAGLWAGAFGLLLVMLFSLFYYRGLGIVVVGSLILAGAITYAAVAFLSHKAGLTVDLPGIAGLIVAVGITADSFIVYFERIRDEMRDGKSMRVAVDAAWLRARNTCLAADSVSLIAALTLYFTATNEVKGFAFMLGLATVIDLVVFFYFTHPLVKLLSLRRFFNRGHRLSGLDANALGIDAINVGGQA